MDTKSREVGGDLGRRTEYLHGLKVSTSRLLVMCKGKNNSAYNGEMGRHLHQVIKLYATNER